VIQYDKSMQNVVFSQLIELAQDPSDAALAEKCSRVLLGNWQDFLLGIIEKAKTMNIWENLTNFKPFLGSLFQSKPGIVDAAFSLFSEKVQSRFVLVWLRFESLRIVPPSKWPLAQFDLKDDVKYSLSSANPDLKIGGLLVWSKSPITSIPFPQNVFFSDSPKYVSEFATIFEQLVSTKPLDPAALSGYLCEHMNPGFATFHRGFNFELLKILWKFHPKKLECQLRACWSLLTDHSGRFRRKIGPELQRICEADPSARSILERIGYVNSEAPPSQNNGAQLLECVSQFPNLDLSVCDSFMTLLQNSANKFSDEVIVQASQQLFAFFLHTKHQGMAARCPQILHVIGSRLPDRGIIENWTARVLEFLDNFDMANLRRSASLPYLALSLVRLQESKLHEIAKVLLKMMNESSNESEVVHSLNVVAVILRDRISAEIETWLCPAVFDSIFDLALKWHSWDFVSALNSCLAGFLQKLCKRSGSSLNFAQFCQKLTRAIQKMTPILQSSQFHPVYLALTVLMTFSPEGTEKLTEVVFPLVSHKNSRIRRIAARVFVRSLPQTAATQVLGKVMAELQSPSNRVNQVHGCILIMKEICDAKPELRTTLPIPKFYPDLPDFLLDDIFSLSRDLTTDRDRALLKRRHVDPAAVAERIQENPGPAVLIESLAFLCKLRHSVPSPVLTNLLVREKALEIQAHLIRLLQFSNPTRQDFVALHDTFEALAFDLKEELVSIHLALAESIGLIKQNDPKFALIAIPLVISDIPQVRYRTVFGLVPDLNEIDLVEQLLRESRKDDVWWVFEKWIQLMERLLARDGFGEPMTVFVDEFFIPRKCLEVLNVRFDFNMYFIGNIAEIRPAIVLALRAIGRDKA
jgi:hypothetical protein